MKKVMLVLLVVLVGAMMATAQVNLSNNYSSSTDVLGAHLLYGRGCIGCHAPHSGSGGNGLNPQTDPTSGNLALWGQDLTPLYNQTVSFGDNGAYAVTFPANGSGITSAHDPTAVVLFCLSCHDGNLAKVGWMKGRTVETLPIVGGTAPTLLGNDGTTAGNYHNDHPVGPQAIIGCGGTYDWDCTIVGGKIQMTGPNSHQFATVNYGFTVSQAVVNNNPTVTCTTCHDQHSMTVWQGTSTNSAKVGYYQTSFFVRGPYQPQTGGNNAAQFCRNCHGGEANEMHNSPNVPTT
jgi:cytochrome c553